MFKDLLHILISVTYYHFSHFNVKGLYEVTFTLKFVTQVVQTNTNFDMCRGSDDMWVYGDCAETCRSKLIVKYTVYRVVHILVLIECMIHCTVHGTNDM